MKKNSLWLETAPPSDFPKLQGRVEVDALIVGGGITGLTTAYLLLKEGKSVAVVDIQNIGGGETSHTTAHITFVTDTRLNELVSHVGKKKAQALWDAGQSAMKQIEAIVEELKIECELRHVPGYLFAAIDKDAADEAKSLQEDAKLASEFGFDVQWLEADPLFGRPAVGFPNQLKFHPLKYINALAKAVAKAGGHVFSKTSGSHIDGEKHELHTKDGTIAYHTLIAATHVPIQGERGTLGAALFQTKLAGYSTYAIEAKIEEAPEALFWDTNDPYQYIRIEKQAGEFSVIFGGEDHKTGQDEATEACYARLEAQLMEKFPSAKPRHRWSGQVLETPDGLPYIGEVAEHQLLATGFSGNGMTLGTFSAMVLRDLVAGRENPWNGLFNPSRKVLSGAWDYLVENKDYPLWFLKEHLRPASEEKPHRCCGDIAKVAGKKQAVYVDEHGKKTVLSAVCPHMGCIVRWNEAEKTWDCPCHGSRFRATGEVITGPAETNLEPVK